MKKLTTCLLFISLAGIISCKKSVEKTNSTTTNVQKIAPDGFNFATSRNVSLTLSLLSPKGEALSGVVVSVYRPSNTTSGTAIFRGVTDKNGNLNAKISVPTYLTSLIIDPAYLGLLHFATANINGNAITATIGGPKVYSGDIVPAPVVTGGSSSGNLLSIRNSDVTSGSTTFTYPAPYTSTADAVLNTTEFPSNDGVPKYLEATSDVISATLLSYVNASLPEGQPLTTTHPAFLASTDVSTLNVIAKSDVWITFVAEGAGNLNSLAYYTYPTNTPPQSPSDITAATLIFPNASGLGSGGGLLAGDKVKLGTFDAGTSIGFILLGNAWTGSGVDVDAPKYYSDNDLNPETDPSLQKHSVVLYDATDQLTLIGFEDLNRQTGSDNDFNDLVFYATSNPVTGISNTNIPPIAKPNDADGDGVPDNEDAFPNDPTRAYINYYPSQTGWANIAFEDNWPTKGDYDMNDLVLGYRYTFVSNAQNQVVTIQADYNIMAVGASFKNGFGLQLPIAASAVQSVTGEQFKDNYIQLASNGVEAGQSKAVIIPFDNTDQLINNPGDAYFINTENSKDKVTQTTVSSVLITLTTPIAQSSLDVSTFNPFLISNERRGYEIHLPGYAPTDKADPSLFGTGDDTSVPSSGRYYQSATNMPWALSFGDTFIYPLETVNITSAYLHFADWAASAGSAFTDWYTNPAPDYRVPADLYLK